MKYYKAVYLNNGNKESICLNREIVGDDREYAITYRQGEWVKPKIKKSGLFCFGSLRSANDFIYSQYGHQLDEVELWECKVQNPRVITYVRYENIVNFWLNVEKLKSKKVSAKDILFKLGTQRAPSDSFICSSIKLDKQVSHT